MVLVGPIKLDGSWLELLFGFRYNHNRVVSNMIGDYTLGDNNGGFFYLVYKG